MILEFKLSMPNVGSWNGKWSCEGEYFAKIITFRGKKNIERAKEMLKEGSYFYDFGDGWGACVSIRQVDSREASKLRRKTQGFRGYDWMVDSIIDNDCIVIKRR